MPSPLIKICGIQTPELARNAALSGAHFIGLVFHYKSKRYVDIEQAKLISTVLREQHAIPVAVFVNQTAAEMHEICLQTHIQTIQLHGSIPKKQHIMLAAHYQRFYVQTVTAQGHINPDEEAGLIHCNPERDYLLFDSIQPGKGQPFSWDTFKYSGPFRMGLGGGLTSQNVSTAIKKCQPALVDVSSGVENKSNKKDCILIQKFIKAVQRV